MARHDNRTQPQLQNLLDGWFNNPAGPANRPEFVVVIDVGQGNANAVFNAAGQPFLYFDFGGGIDGSLFTFPDPAPRLCYHANPKFMLSHWDGDHIKMIDAEVTANRIGNSAWLAPTQEANRRGVRLGLSKRAKAVRLKISAGVRDLYLWPDDLVGGPIVASITSSYFTVIKVTGNDLNNHSLALRIDSPDPNHADDLLLTGDASYQPNTFPHNCQSCVGVVTSHHGAEIDTPADVPQPQAGGYHALAYSFGWGNAYGHPSTTGVDAYLTTALWPDDHRLDTGGGEKGADYGGPRGNVGLLWRVAHRGPCRGDNPLTDAGRDDGAIQLLAAASEEARLFEGATSGHAAAAAAHEAAIMANAPDIAQAMRQPYGVDVNNAAVTLLARATNQGAPRPALSDALTRAPAAAGAADDVNIRALADAVVDAVLTAAARAANDITTEAINNAAGRDIGSQSRSSSIAAYNLASDANGNGTLLAAVTGAITNPLADAIINAAQAVQNVNLPNRAAVKGAVASAVCLAAAHAIGHTDAGYGAIQYAKLPPAVAGAAVVPLNLLRVELNAAIAAAAALVPSAAINPEAGAPNANAVLGNAYHRRVARVATVAAIVAVRTGNENAARACKAAVAAARIAVPAANGAPLIACHRHPNVCNDSCHLGIHYAAL